MQYQEQAILFITVLLAGVVLTVLAERWLIPVLKSHKMGQKILDIGPRWHKSKEGTPTMGGLAFLIVSAVIMAGVAAFAAAQGWNEAWTAAFLGYGLALANGAIGIFDDYTKLVHKQNEGLTPKQKLLLQLLAAGLYLFGMRAAGLLETTLYIPYAGIEWELGIFYYIFALILICGVVNAVNLTDGIDGLASCVTAAVAAFFAVCSFVAYRADTAAFTVLPALICGICLGFLVYNYYPARVFMGDTGSLFLGGAVVAMAFIINNPLIIVVAGLLYIIECVSVMLQVLYFKCTHGKRLFRMAPIHHHFEKGGWSEPKVVAVFTVFTVCMCVIAFFGR
mgnify:FL=1